MTTPSAIGHVAAHPLVALGVVLVTMLVESWLAGRHERRLRARGAIEPPGDVYGSMQVAYPLGFAACLLEGWWRGPEWTVVSAVGLLVFTAGKTIKYVAMATLGDRWTFRVLTLPGAPLVRRGIYRWLRHPNYVGVGGEILGMALWMRAPVAGAVFAVGFGWLLRARIRVEERALESAAQR